MDICRGKTSLERGFHTTWSVVETRKDVELNAIFFTYDDRPIGAMVDRVNMFINSGSGGGPTLHCS